MICSELFEGIGVARVLRFILLLTTHMALSLHVFCLLLQEPLVDLFNAVVLLLLLVAGHLEELGP